MDWLTQIDTEKFLLFTLVLTRVSGLTMTAPIYGTKDVPMQVRGLLAVTLALLITPGQWDTPIVYPQNTLNYMVFVGAELLIGVCLGLGVMLLFSGVYLAGQLIGRVGGLMLADVFDPGLQASVPTISRLLYIVTLAVFVCSGGHRMVMAALLATFAAIPTGGGALPTSMTETFVLILQESFCLAVRAAAPIVTALLLSTMVLGLIGRTLPQLNILMVGFGLNSMLSFGTLFLTVGIIAMAFQSRLEPVLELLVDALRTPRPP